MNYPSHRVGIPTQGLLIPKSLFFPDCSRSQKNKLIVIIIIVVSHQVWERSSDRKDKKGCVSPKLSGFKDNSSVFFMILWVLPELTPAADGSAGSCRVAWASAGKVGKDIWVAESLFRCDLSSQASSPENGNLQNGGSKPFGGSQAPRSNLRLLDRRSQGASPDKEWRKRLHPQTGGARNHLWPLKIHQNLQTGLSRSSWVS